MIGNLARKRTNLAALAVLAALIGAMLVALPPARAVGLGDCETSGTTLMGLDDSCSFTENTGEVAGGEDVGDPVSSNPAVASVTSGEITAESYGTATITQDAVVDNPDTENINEALAAISLTVQVRKIEVTKIEFGSFDDNDTASDRSDDTFTADTDNVFAAGANVAVRVTVSYSQADQPRVTVSVPTTGLSLLAISPSGVRGTSQSLVSDATGDPVRDPGMATVKVQGAHTLLTDGAPAGEYTVTATAANGAVISNKATAKLTIGDAGDTVGSATLALGLSEGYGSPDVSTHTAETGTDSQTGSINLEVNVLNGIGNPVNASDVDEIRIVAPFGDVMYSSTGSASDPFAVAMSNSIPGIALAKGRVIVQIASSNDVARTIDVRAIALGSRSGVADTDTVTLTFTGDANSMTVDDATKTLRSVNVERDSSNNLVNDTIMLLVSATDKGGNTANPPSSLSFTISDPDGRTVSSNVIRASQANRGTDGKWRITVTNVSGDSASTALKTGEYTLKATSGSISDSASFTVAGGAMNVSVSASDAAPTAYGTITATASVTDEDGAVAADGTAVQFSSSDDKVLKEVGDTSAKNTKDGSVSQQFAVVGAGTALIIANVGNVSDVAVIESTAGGTAAADSEAMMAGTECLTNLAAFTSWQCEEGVNVSEIFAELSGRGATAIHLWNTTRWVRYAVVDGVEIVGSNDFLIKQGDTLYISN